MDQILLLACLCFSAGFAASLCQTNSTVAAAGDRGDSDTATRGAISVLLVVEENCADAGGCSAGWVDQEEVINAVELAVRHVNAENLCTLNGQRLQLFTESAQVRIRIQLQTG